MAWRCLHGVYGAQTSNEQRTRKWTSQKGGGLTRFPLSLPLRWRHVTRTLRGFFFAYTHRAASEGEREKKQRKRGVFNCPNDLVPVPLPWILGRLTHFWRPDFATLSKFWAKCSSSPAVYIVWPFLVAPIVMFFRGHIPAHAHIVRQWASVGPTDADGDILY